MTDMYFERPLSLDLKDDTSFTVEAHVFAHFAYHRTFPDTSLRYSVTHLPTGRRVIKDVTIATAQRIILGLELLPVDWDSTDPASFATAQIADAVAALCNLPPLREPMIHHLPVSPLVFAAHAAPEHLRCGVLVVPAGDYLSGDTIVLQDGDRLCQRRLTHMLADAPWLPPEHVALSLVAPNTIVPGWWDLPMTKPIPSVFPGPAPGPWFRVSSRPGYVSIQTGVVIAPDNEYIGEVREKNAALVIAAPQLWDACRRAYIDAMDGHLPSAATMQHLLDALLCVDDSRFTGLRPELPDPPGPELHSIALFARRNSERDRFIVITSEPGREGDWEEQGYALMGALLVETARRDLPLDLFDMPWYPEKATKPASRRKKAPEGDT